MFSRLWQWLQQSHRLLHIGVGALTGLSLGFPAAVSAAIAFEAKDYQWGGKPSLIDALLTIAGSLPTSALHYYLRYLILSNL